jgi:hypothetical protein
VLSLSLQASVSRTDHARSSGTFGLRHSRAPVILDAFRTLTKKTTRKHEASRGDESRHATRLFESTMPEKRRAPVKSYQFQLLTGERTTYTKRVQNAINRQWMVYERQLNDLNGARSCVKQFYNIDHVDVVLRESCIMLACLANFAI